MGARPERDVHIARAVMVAALVFACLAFVAGAALFADDPWARHAWADAIWSLASLAAAVKAYRSSQRAVDARTRSALRAVALGCLSWFCGMMVWSYDELVRHRTTPFPSVADAFYAVLPLSIVAAFGRFGTERPTLPMRVRQWGDALVLFLGIAMVCVTLAAGRHGQGSVEARATALGHIVVHLGSMAVVVVRFLQRSYLPAHRRVLRLLVHALALLAIVETHYSAAVLDGTYEAGHGMDVFWVAAFAVLVAACYEHDFDPVANPAPLYGPLVADVQLPLVLCVVGATVLVSIERLGPAEAHVLVGLGSALGVAGFVRGVGATRLELRLREDQAVRARLMEDAQRLEATGLLAGGIAHDFNNLLTGLLATLGVLRRKALSEPVLASLDLMEHATLRAATLSKRLLSLARPRPPSMAAADPREIVRRVVTMLRAASPHEVSIEVDDDDAPRAVVVDAGQIEQALLNLGLNAVGAVGGRGRVVFRIRTGVVDAATVLSFEVEDDGIGMDPGTLGRVMEPFFTTRGEAGTGLGLAVVRTVAEAHGGRLSVRSEAGRGACFVVTVPCVEAEVRDERAEEEVRGGYETVVAVDDHAGSLLALSAALESAGYRVFPTADPTTALDLCVEVDATLLVTDADMPRLSGRSLLAAARSARPSMRTLLVSGTAEDTSDAMGADGFVAKPYRVDDLLRAVRVVLDGAAHRRSDAELRQAERSRGAS